VANGAVKNKLNSYFNSACFALNPTTGAPSYPVIGSDGMATGFGNSGVGLALGPSQRNWDIALVKHTALKWPDPSAEVEFRTEFFNAWNTAQFSNPDTNLSDSTFGVVTSTAVSPRIIQFALKLSF
jgi:hypothetical protein